MEASYGIGDVIVGGKVGPDNYLIDRKTLEAKEKNIGDKSKMSIYQSGKIKVVDVEDEARKVQVMSDVKLRENAET